jgi:hypothetical protein
MEPQTRFDLTAALQNWREELAAQSDLTAETRRELETHVTDTVAEMRQRGLNDEESFWLARRRVGQPKELGQEFAQVEVPHPGRKWLLWIAVAFYVLDLWQSVVTYAGLVFSSQIAPIIFGKAANSSTVYSFAYLSPAIITVLAHVFVALLGIYVALSRSGAKFITWRSFDPSRRRRLVVYSFLLLLVIRYSQIAMLSRGLQNSVTTYQYLIVLMSLPSVIWPLILAALIFWLSPTEKSRAMQRA